MKIELDAKDIMLLQRRDITYRADHDYTDDEALELLDRVRDAEVEYAQDSGNEREKLFFQYSALGDKIFSQI